MDPKWTPNKIRLWPVRDFYNSLQYQWTWSVIECYKIFVPPYPSPIGCWMDR